MRIRTASLGLLATLILGCTAMTPHGALAANGDSKMFTLGELTFKGNQRVPTDKLNSVSGLTPGDKVNRDAVVAAFANVQAEYQKENVGGTIQPSMAVHGGTMDVTFDIKEDAPEVAKTIPLVLDHETVTGNVKVKSPQLVGALTLKPGDVVDTAHVKADLDALTAVYKGANLGALITPKVSYPSKGHVDLNFEVVENPKG